MDNKKYKITNTGFGTVVYTLPELNNLRRSFAPGETKEVRKEELEALTYLPGGEKLINKYLRIEDRELVEELLGEDSVEPEYFMTEEDIKNFIISSSYEEFLDCLDFAPEGRLDLIKRFAVELPLNDSQKREAIREKLKFDVDKALALINAPEEEGEESEIKADEKKRRVKKPPTYKVVEK